MKKQKFGSKAAAVPKVPKVKAPKPMKASAPKRKKQ
jgi:hypothetical protein